MPTTTFRPQFEIRFAKKTEELKTDSKNLSAKLRSHIKSLTLIDEIEGSADHLTIRLADKGESLSFPNIGDKLSIQLGYEETGLKDYGYYTIEDIEFSGYPGELTFSCTSVDFSSHLYVKRNEAYESTSLKSLANLIAARKEYENLKLKSEVYLNSPEVIFKHIAQTNESDLHLLRRISESLGADFSIKKNAITILARDKAKLKEKYDPVVLNPEHISSFLVEHNNRFNYSKVIAKWWDPNQATLRDIEYPTNIDEGVPLVIQKVFNDMEQAKGEAVGRFQSMNRLQKFGHISMPGKNGIYAGTVVELASDTIGKVGFREIEKNNVQKEYAVTQVVHTMDSDGWQMNLRLGG
jgi:uncharacterized protein